MIISFFSSFNDDRWTVWYMRWSLVIWRKKNFRISNGLSYMFAKGWAQRLRKRRKDVFRHYCEKLFSWFNHKSFSYGSYGFKIVNFFFWLRLAQKIFYLLSRLQLIIVDFLSFVYVTLMAGKRMLLKHA